jgi:BirA family biotin operon repressor/biotin-[acetyl-CoA-carboxylase] ligase
LYNKPTNTIFTGSDIIFLPTCPSTNQVALELARYKPFKNGTVVITENQTQGRGQRGKKWESAPGLNLTLSILYTPTFIPSRPIFSLTAFTAVGVCNAVQSFVSSPVRIKWPNDVYIDERKVGGILVENVWQGQQLKASVIGIGCNVLQDTWPESISATSLKIEGGSAIQLEHVWETLLTEVEAVYLQSSSDFDSVFQSYIELLLGLGQHVEAVYNGASITGTLKSVSSDGLLTLDTVDNGTIIDYHPNLVLTKCF